MVRVSTPPPDHTHKAILEPALKEVVSETKTPNGIRIATMLATVLQLVAIQPGQTAIAGTQTVTVGVGGKAVQLPAPAGFYSIGELYPDITQVLAETMVPPENRLLEVFVSERDLGLLMMGQSPNFERYMLVQVHKQTESTDISSHQFSQFVELIKQQQYSMLSGVRDRVSALLDQTSGRMSEDYGIEAQREIGEQVSLGVFLETNNSLGVANLTKYKVSEGNEQIEHVVAGATMFVEVKNRLIYVYVYGSYQDTGDLDWVRSTSSSWAKKITAANFEQQSRGPTGRNTRGLSFDWSKVIEKGAAGVVVGGIMGLLFAVFHGIKRVFGKSKNYDA